MEPDDVKIQIIKNLSEEIKKFIYALYDEETETQYEYPILKEIDLSSLIFLFLRI